MPRGLVVDLGENGAALFSASVTFDENGPFDHVNGPDRVSSHEALAWARRHAERITARVSDVLYIAGARASTGWFRDDRKAVLERLAKEVRADSVVEAQEETSRIMRMAWTATGATASAGHDFDVCSMSVTADAPSATL